MSSTLFQARTTPATPFAMIGEVGVSREKSDTNETCCSCLCRFFCIIGHRSLCLLSCELCTDSSRDSNDRGSEQLSSCDGRLRNFECWLGLPPPEFRGTCVGMAVLPGIDVPSVLTHCDDIVVHVHCVKVGGSSTALDVSRPSVAQGTPAAQLPTLNPSLLHAIIPFCLSPSIIGIHRPSVLIAQLVFAGAFD